MKTLNKSIILIFLIFSILLSTAVVSAQDTTNSTKTISNDDGIQITNNNDLEKVEDNNVIKNEEKNDKIIKEKTDAKKVSNNKMADKKKTQVYDTTKSLKSSQEVTVSNYTELYNTISNSQDSKLSITLNEGTYYSTGTIKLTSNSTINDLTINGNGQTISGGYNQFLDISSGISVTLNNIELSNSNTKNVGAIYNEGKLTINNSTFKNNNVKGDGGVIYNKDGTVNINHSIFTQNIAWDGGAIYNFQYKGTLKILNSEFTYNQASNGGAISNYHSMITIINTTFINNTSTSLLGGAIDGKGNIRNCTFINNTASQSGGAMNTRQGSDVTDCIFIDNKADYGGAINGPSDTTNCIFINNHGSVRGGAVHDRDGANVINSIFINNTSVTGGAVYVDCKNYIQNSIFIGNIAEYGAAIYNNNYLSRITDCNFTGNNATSGGAIYNNKDLAIITDCNFTDNNATTGGAIFAGYSVNIEDSIFTNNSAQSNGGVIYINHVYSGISNCNFTGNNATTGGAIYNNKGRLYADTLIFKVNNATTGGAICNNQGYSEITNTLFTNNSAQSNGGAVYDSYGNSRIINTTFANNNAGRGGAIRSHCDNLTFVNTSFISNTADKVAGAIFNYNGTLIFNNTTFKDNTAKTNQTIYNTGNITYIGMVNSQISLHDYNMYILDYSDIVVNVTDDFGNPVNGGYVIFKVNGVTLKSNGKFYSQEQNPMKFNVVNGKATIVFNATSFYNKKDIQNMIVKYSGVNDKYASASSDTKTLTINKRIGCMTVTTDKSSYNLYETVNIKATYYDITYGNATQIYSDDTCYAIYKINGITSKVNGSNERFIINNSQVAIGNNSQSQLNYIHIDHTAPNKKVNHTIEVKTHNQYYTTLENKTTFIINKSSTFFDISEITYNKTSNAITVTADIKDYMNNNIKGTSYCSLKINGITYYINGKRTFEVTNGKIQLTLNSSSKHVRSIELVTGEKHAYYGSRNTSTDINAVD